MATLQFRFIAEPKVGSALIRYGTWSPYSHVDLIVPNKGYLGARLRGGVKLRPANYTKPSKSLVKSVPVSQAQLEKAIEFAMSQRRKPYDWRAILAFVFHRLSRPDPSAWFCSEFATAILEHIGITPFDREPVGRITPRDLVIWSGWQ